MNYIFIDSKDEIEKVGLVEDGRLVEFYMEENTSKNTLGNIYRGRIEKVEKGMDAAFINIGEDRNAYLHLKQALPKDKMYKNKSYYIDDILKEGRDIIVQIIKEADGNKGAKVTTHIELKGRYIILTPFSNQINVSKKIYKREDINRLRDLSEDLIKKDAGFILRTASKNAEEDKIVSEYNFLFDIYEKIEREKNYLPSPKLIYKEPSIGYQIIRDLYSEDINEVKINSENDYKDLILMEENYPFKFSDKLILDKKFSIILEQNLIRNIKSSLSRRVNLKSGAHIIIDQLEALTVIDVNTGKFTGSRSLKDTIMKTNIEAAEEIARQIRLRDIGGIIIIDFIDMRSKEDEKKLLGVFNSHLKRDRNKANIIDITKLGLLEMTRSKKRKTSISSYYSICSKCGVL